MVFRIQTITLLGATHKYNAITCGTCGAVVGIVDYLNVGAMVARIWDKLGITN